MRACWPLAHALILLAAMAPAQTHRLRDDTRYVPAYASTRSGPTFSLYPFFPDRSFRVRTQHLIEGAAICKSFALMKSFSYRTAGRGFGAHAAHTYRVLTLIVGYCTRSPDSMSMYYAINRTGPQTVIINRGSYRLPAVPKATPAGPWNVVFPLGRPWLYRPSQGNLLIETVVADVPESYYWYSLDADIAGGASLGIGWGGRFANGRRASLALNFQTRMHPGGRIELIPQAPGWSGMQPGYAFFGLSRTRCGSGSARRHRR